MRATPIRSSSPPAADLGGRPHPAELDFDPASTRHRVDGITPEKQREYVEALADTGIVRYAAARVGVSPQAINRLRRKPEARSFDLACAAAQRIGARRVHDIGWERALEGQIKRHYYHGQLAGEERVYDNKLLIYLMGKTEHLLDEPEETPDVIASWTPWVEAMEQGAPPPALRPPEPEPTLPRERPIDEFDGTECWEFGRHLVDAISAARRFRRDRGRPPRVPQLPAHPERGRAGGDRCRPRRRPRLDRL